jgi:poly-gamma-glutamate synthase PgsB/CapB
MAIDPELQRFTERKLIQSQVGVITNVRSDHQEVMGYTLEEVAQSLAGTISKNGTLFTSEDRYFPVLEERGRMLGTSVEKVSPITDNSFLSRFAYLEHEENVALALRVCEHLGVPPDTALEGMVQAKPDMGVLTVWAHRGERVSIHFVNAFAANDPDSIALIWNRLKDKRESYREVFILLNLRKDRIYRSSSLAELISSTLSNDGIFLVGDYTATVAMNLASRGVKSSMIFRLNFDSVEEIIKEIESRSHSNEVLLFGLGNMGGWGVKIVKYFEERGERIDCRSDRSWTAF